MIECSNDQEETNIHPRCEIYIEEKAKIEFWCIKDLMSPSVSSSSTEEKWRILPKIFDYDSKKADFVMAMGTAAFYNDTSYNGCVVMGSKTFLYNPYTKENPNTDKRGSNWDIEHSMCEKLYESIESKKFFNVFFRSFNNKELRPRIETRFLATPLNPAQDRIFLFAYNYIALGVVNITNYDNYSWADHKAVEAIEEKEKILDPIGSMETTHGIIRLKKPDNTPFIFISGIADRLGHFNMEVTPRLYAQNFIAAHNAGVTVMWILPEVIDFLKEIE